MPYMIATVYTFIETRLFTKLTQKYLDEDTYSGIQSHLIVNPEAGDLVPGSGGVRKLRWSLRDRGKRGGVRIIYYARTRQGQIWMLTLYNKSTESNIPAHTLRLIKEEIDA